MTARMLQVLVIDVLVLLILRSLCSKHIILYAVLFM
jgi:hypothetical protein